MTESYESLDSTKSNNTKSSPVQKSSTRLSVAFDIVYKIVIVLVGIFAGVFLGSTIAVMTGLIDITC